MHRERKEAKSGPKCGSYVIKLGAITETGIGKWKWKLGRLSFLGRWWKFSCDSLCYCYCYCYCYYYYYHHYLNLHNHERGQYEHWWLLFAAIVLMIIIAITIKYYQCTVSVVWPKLWWKGQNVSVISRLLLKSLIVSSLFFFFHPFLFSLCLQ